MNYEYTVDWNLHSIFAGYSTDVKIVSYTCMHVQMKTTVKC